VKLLYPKFVHSKKTGWLCQLIFRNCGGSEARKFMFLTPAGGILLAEGQRDGFPHTPHPLAAQEDATQPSTGLTTDKSRKVFIMKFFDSRFVFAIITGWNYP
jgi:hypothetical protein